MFLSWAVVKARQISRTIKHLILTILAINTTLWHHSPNDITPSVIFFLRVNKVAALTKPKQFTRSHISICAFQPLNWSGKLA